MESKNETVSKVIDDFAYLITLGNIRPAVATNIKSRIEAAHKRKLAEVAADCAWCEREYGNDRNNSANGNQK